MDRTLSITIPEDVFKKLQHAANSTQQTIDDVIVNTVNITFAGPTGLPETLADELAVMRQMKDQELWEMVEPSSTTQQRERLDTLNIISEQRPLSLAEIQEQQTLLAAHHRSVHHRAQAIAMLALRGHEVSDKHLAETVI